MSEIALNGIRLKGPIGVHEVEKKNGNEFLIDISVETDTGKAAKNDDINSTIDYEELYLIVKEVISQPIDLMETAVHKICRRILKNYKKIKWVKVKIAKLNPPISGKCESASIELILTRNN